MRALHLFSNAKWTGPAEPALTLCAELRKIGVDADFACPPTAPGSPYTLLDTARAWGIDPIVRFTLSKHRDPLKNFFDVRRLRAFLKEQPYDLLHCHLNNDHRIAVRAARTIGCPIVRSNYDGLGFSDAGRVRPLLANTAAVIEPSWRAMEHDAQQFGLKAGQLFVVDGAVDTVRFDPARSLADMRPDLGIPADAFVIGIVARMQPHRHFEDFFAALQRLAQDDRHIHALVVGRGTRQEAVAKQPVRELGLEDRVHFAGFVRDDDFVRAVQAFDVKVFLVPGTDGTCRAVREAMAMGKPTIVANRGMLPEIVDHEVNGLVFGLTADELYTALKAVCRDRDRVRAMGLAARQKAVERFAPRVQAESVARVYERILAMRAGEMGGDS